MPDITMCSGERCPLKQICYRHTAKPSNYQSYFVKAPVLGGTCEYFWGDKAESIMNQIQYIVKEKAK